MAKFKPAQRLNLPAYPFAELERKASAIRANGSRLHDLSIGDPDLPPPQFVIDAVKRALDDPASHTYPSSRGNIDVRKTIAKWFQGRFGVEVDPTSQICITIGGKEALAQFARATVNPGEVVAFPDPCYPVFRRAGTFMLDAIPKRLPLFAENGFLPKLDKIEGVKLLFVNYPNNPTGASATESFLQELAVFADNFPSSSVAYDMAYSEMTFGAPSRSLLEFTPNAVEFHSLSKMANATGYRIGFAIGEPNRIAALVRVKEEMDSGAPLPFQRALQAVLESYDGTVPPPELSANRQRYHKRKQRLESSIKKAGFQLFQTDATFYIWFKVGANELSYTNKLVENHLLLTPGSGFGEGGIGWVRASVTAPDEDIDAAAEIIERIGSEFN